MFDERWSPDAAEVARSLQSLLEAKSDDAAVRAAEASTIGWSPEVDGHLRNFGAYDLPPEPELLATVAIVLGRCLAPVPWVEEVAVTSTLAVTGAVAAYRGRAPLGRDQAVIAGEAEALLVHVEGAGARTSAGDVLVEVGSLDPVRTWTGDDADRLLRQLRFLGAARIVGSASKLLEIGVGYAKERFAFGKPIGSYQAVSHRLADVAIAIEGAELMVKKSTFAARSTDGAVPPAIFSLMAWANAVDAGRLACRAVHQVMGGFGATLEYPAQLHARRIRSWALRGERPRDAYRQIADMAVDQQRRAGIRGLWHEEEGITIPRWVRDLDSQR